MAIATSNRMTVEEFLAFDDGTDYLYELEYGELIQVPVESEINRRIAMFLVIFFSQFGIPPSRISTKTELEVSGQRTSVRIPDLVLFSEELSNVLKGASRSIVRLDMPPPDLVVEIVSPNQESRDYRYKRSEYGARGIKEYWIVDSVKSQVLLLEWVEGFYEDRLFGGGEQIVSPLLGALNLDAAKILAAGE
jgi:Uma2 family endonuclease